MFETVLFGAMMLTFMMSVFPLILSRDKAYVMKWAGNGFVFNLFLMGLIVYSTLPAMTGPLNGWEFMWLPILINLGLSMGIFFNKSSIPNKENEEEVHYLAMISAAVAFLALALMALSVWFTGSLAKDGEKSKFANISMAPVMMMVNEDGSASERVIPMPEINEDYITFVSRGLAGSMAFSSLSDDMRSVYSWDDLSLVSLRGRLYWVSLMAFKDEISWIQSPSKIIPSLIMIDALDPLYPSHGSVNYPMTYTDGNFFRYDVRRHLYVNGYSDRILLEPQVVISDDLRVYEAVGLGSHVFGWSGVEVVGIALVDVQTGEIRSCPISDCPEWADLAFPQSVINTYVDWYRPDHLRRTDDSPMVFFDREGHFSLMYIMTGIKETDLAAGAIIYDSRSRKGTYYPFDGPIPLGYRAAFLFEKNKDLARSQVSVDQLRLVRIYGEYTLIATMVNRNWAGRPVYRFTAFLKADSGATSENVQYDVSPRQALRNYLMSLVNSSDHWRNP